MTKIILAYELLVEGVSKSRIAKHLGVSRRTIIRWSQAIEKHGSLDAFLEQHAQAKKGSRKKRKIDAILKRRIWALREKHHQCCGQKIQYFLEKEYAQQGNFPIDLQIVGAAWGEKNVFTNRVCLRKSND